jgi:GNAT superfamily N-acetyltransferase
VDRFVSQPVLDAHARLLANGVLAEVDQDAMDQVRYWVRCDLANMVEGCFHVQIDPLRLGDAEQRVWLDRLGESYLPPPLDELKVYERRFWMLEGRMPVGTILLYTYITDEATVPTYALYTFPEHRGHGTATRVLAAVQETLTFHGLGGVRLDTYWTWQRSLRFYLDRCWWVVRWKYNIELITHTDLPSYRVRFHGDHARFEIARPAGWVPLLVASRMGSRLALDRTADLERMSASPRDRLVRDTCLQTFAVVLAVNGWPLIRSDERWLDAWSSVDGGEPEGLALKIEIYEAHARQHGWMIGTPRIPGVRYRDLNEIR